MSRHFDLQRIAPVVAVVAVAAIGLFLVSRSMGGSEGGSKGAEEVLAEAFSGQAKGPQSGRLRGNMSLSVAGPAGAALLGGQPLTVQIRGVVNGSAAAKTPPSFDVDMTMQGGGENHSFSVVSTGRRGFVEVDGKAYEIPKSQVNQLAPGSERGSDADSAALKALGVDPGKWVTNVTEAGTEQVAGEATTHVTADVDTSRFFADVLRMAERTGQAAQIPAEARDTLQDSVKQAKLDVYVAKRDGTVRKLALSAQFEAANPRGGDPVTGDFRFDLQFTGVGKPQRIVPPANAAPLSDFDGLDGLGGLGTLQGAGTPTPGTGGDSNAKQPSSGTANPNRGSSRQAEAQAYVTCVQQAQDVQALNKCQSLVP